MSIQFQDSLRLQPGNELILGTAQTNPIARSLAVAARRPAVPRGVWTRFAKDPIEAHRRR
jgi:hypothetical protein